LFIKYYRGFADVRYANLVLPGSWPDYRISEGSYYIESAASLPQKVKAATALQHLRSGVTKATANAKGRTTLAGLYLAYRRPDLARDTLLAGLHFLTNDAAYLETTLSYLLEIQEDARLIEITKPLLDPSAPADATCRAIAATYAATAAHYRGNYDLTEDLLTQHHLRETLDGVTLLARIEWENGHPELALLKLQDYRSLHPAHDRARTLLASYHRSLKRTNEWEPTIVERLVSDPLAAAPRSSISISIINGETWPAWKARPHPASASSNATPRPSCCSLISPPIPAGRLWRGASSKSSPPATTTPGRPR
jgi:hypothetical protein